MLPRNPSLKKQESSVSAQSDTDFNLDQELLIDGSDDSYDPNKSDYDPNEPDENSISPQRHFGLIETIEKTPQVEQQEQEDDLEDLKKLQFEISDQKSEFTQLEDFQAKLHESGFQETPKQSFGIESTQSRISIQRPVLEDAGRNFLEFRPELLIGRTPDYLSPLAVENIENSDEKTDIYSENFRKIGQGDIFRTGTDFNLLEIKDNYCETQKLSPVSNQIQSLSPNYNFLAEGSPTQSESLKASKNSGIMISPEFVDTSNAKNFEYAEEHIYFNNYETPEIRNFLEPFQGQKFEGLTQSLSEESNDQRLVSPVDFLAQQEVNNRTAHLLDNPPYSTAPKKNSLVEQVLEKNLQGLVQKELDTPRTQMIRVTSIKTNSSSKRSTKFGQSRISQGKQQEINPGRKQANLSTNRTSSLRKDVHYATSSRLTTNRDSPIGKSGSLIQRNSFPDHQKFLLQDQPLSQWADSPQKQTSRSSNIDIKQLPFSNLIQHFIDQKNLKVEDITLTHYQVPRASEYFKELNKNNKGRDFVSLSDQLSARWATLREARFGKKQGGYG